MASASTTPPPRTRSNCSRTRRRPGPRPRSRARRCSSSATGRCPQSRRPRRRSRCRRSPVGRSAFCRPPYGSSATPTSGGESESEESPFGHQAHGGFDCSGFVWRVYKLETYPGEGNLGDVLRGRTTYAMSGEVSGTKRLPFAKLQPADVVFFGAHGPASKPAEVDHMGIYLGNGWFIHSSGYGVAVAQLSGWYRTHFAWARRPLAEAALSTG
ncbi:MAG: NlpC/P60 family protein [Actinobacteria bacterium]|nr:MAG: NlpC/P60 family protein [Actinomycetota bacterium]